jgi:hypothetical protein
LIRITFLSAAGADFQRLPRLAVAALRPQHPSRRARPQPLVCPRRPGQESNESFDEKLAAIAANSAISSTRSAPSLLEITLFDIENATESQRFPYGFQAA